MKVLFITRKWPPALGGMELYSSELASALDAMPGVELKVLALKGTAKGFAPGLPAILAFLVRAIWYLARNSRRYDVVHFGDFVLFPLAIFDRWICCSHLRFMTVYGLDLTFGRKTGLLPSIYRRFLSFCASRASAVDGYIAISKFTGDLARSVGLAPVTVVPLGIRMESFDEGGERSGETIENEPPFVFYLGRVVPRKGALWFAKEVLPRFGGMLKFVVAGRIYSAAEGKALERLPDVQVLGQIPHQDALSYRKGAVAILMPNIPVMNNADVEGFGLTALEAPAAGSVLIASRLEGIEDAVIDGVTGLLARPGDADDWEEKLRDVLHWDSTRRAEFVRIAHSALKAHYSWGQVARRTVDLYYEALVEKQACRYE